MEVEVALFNSLRRFRREAGSFRIRLGPGARVVDLVERLEIPRDRIYVAFVNGRNVMADLGNRLEEWVELREGDRVAFSGPVPFSRAYGAPVV
jgi:translation initiation factor IF-1